MSPGPRSCVVFLAVLGLLPTACTAILDVDGLREDRARGVFDASPSAESGTDSGVTRGLLGHWAFDEADGDVAVDSSAARNDGFLRAGAGAKPTRAAGKRGGALSFRGGAHVEVTRPLQLSAQLTVAFWVSAPAVASMDQPRLFSQRTQGASWMIKLNGRSMQLSIGDSFAHVGYQLPDDEWHHYAVVFDGRARWYVDGAPVTASDFASSERIGASAGPFRMAVANDLASPFSGRLDDVRLHDVALSADEVRAIFEGR